MLLEQSPDGKLFGTYQSSTGATGTYLVAGFANPSDSSAIGESLALSIFWRSIDGGQSNPTWHWVSGLGGQQVTPEGETPTLDLLHAMVATTDDPGLAGAGTYLDKLIYAPDPGFASLPSRSGSPAGGGDPIDGTWICREDPAVVLTLEVTWPKYGDVAGTLWIAGGIWDIAGFTDTYAAQDGVNLQGLSVCALLGGTGWTVALAGSLDREADVVTVTGFTNQGTAPDSTYLQTKLAALTFVRG
jgi:hypothetical protein